MLHIRMTYFYVSFQQVDKIYKSKAKETNYKLVDQYNF